MFTFIKIKASLQSKNADVDVNIAALCAKFVAIKLSNSKRKLILKCFKKKKLVSSVWCNELNVHFKRMLTILCYNMIRSIC